MAVGKYRKSGSKNYINNSYKDPQQHYHGYYGYGYGGDTIIIYEQNH